MKTHAVLSALGRDRVGVADDLAAALEKRRIHIEDSRMTALRGQFALIVQVCGEADDVTRLHGDLDSLSANLGFGLQLEPIGLARPVARVPEFLIEAFSSGPAAMSAVTGVLKRHAINIESLETEASARSWTSALTFHLKARITIPPSYTLASLEEELRALERERNLDIVITPSHAPTREERLAPTTGT